MHKQNGVCYNKEWYVTKTDARKTELHAQLRLDKWSTAHANKGAHALVCHKAHMLSPLLTRRYLSSVFADPLTQIKP